MHPEEYLDLVDANDKVIGKKLRSEVYTEHMSNIRFVNIFLVNSKGQIWMPRRTADKAIFPSCLDFSAGGHVTSGETYDEAAAKEILEELNINMNAVPHRILGYLTPKDEGIRNFMMVYEIQSDETPDYNPEDFSEFYWLTPQEIMEKVGTGEKFKSHVPPLIERFYL